MVARTSTRQAAQKAKEAITSTTEPSDKASAGLKRKAPSEKAPKTKKKKTEEAEQEAKPSALETKANEEPKPDTDQEAKPSAPETKAKEEREPEAEQEAKPSAPETKEKEETNNQTEQPTKPEGDTEMGVHKSEERENIVSSNIQEKGIIYFFFRPRVNVDDPQGAGDVARSFFVLRPTPLGAELDHNQGPVDKDARCRLMILPKKKFPTTPRERDMGFVEKAGQTMKDLQENFIASRKYETSTRGERTVVEARPYAEGVYALTSTKRASHLAYVLTIPAEPDEVQETFGLRKRGSWIVQAKNPKFPGPGFAQLPKGPEYPEPVLEKFGDLRWVPLEPEFIEYPNAQFLMIGEAENSLGKAATAEGNKEPHEQEPGQELEHLEEENEHRIEALEGDNTIFEDLGLDAKNYGLKTTWTD